jgi:DNA-binding MarR family transcriptional regulator
MKKISAEAELKHIVKEYEVFSLIRLAFFADVLSRYCQIKLKEVNWLTLSSLLLIANRGGAITPTKLANLLLRPNHSVTILLEKMSKDGLVVRRRAGKDRRSVRVTITPSGISYLQKSIKSLKPIEEDIRMFTKLNRLEEIEQDLSLIRFGLIDLISST